MIHQSVERYLASGEARRIPEGVVGIVLADGAEAAAPGAARLLGLGAVAVLVVGSPPDPDALAERGVVRIAAELADAPARADALNALFAALAGRWLVWHHAGEFVFFPFCETRTLGDIAAFLDSERRRVLYTYAFDLYANVLPEPGEDPRGAELFIDRIGYYAFPGAEGALEVYGGLGWRFEELLGNRQRAIGRPALLRPRRGERIGADLRFAEPALDTVSCPWHHNPTGAVVGLRTARRLFRQPGFGAVRPKLIWRGSTPFAWTSRQLLELGLIEPGQWF